MRSKFINQYVIIRSQGAGVFAGILIAKQSNEVRLKSARRLWRWYGAASLSELAVRGVSKPSECKFPCEVEEIEIAGVIEIIPCTPDAQESIMKVPVWTA